MMEKFLPGQLLTALLQSSHSGHVPVYLTLNAGARLASPFLILPSHFVFSRSQVEIQNMKSLSAKFVEQTYIDITRTVITFPGNENEE